jgi:hypothetical protein
MLRLKKCPYFLIVPNLIWCCSKCVQIALVAYWNNSDSQHLFLFCHFILNIFFNHCSICILKVAGAACLGFEYKLRRIVSSSSVQDLNRAAPATFRMQKEPIWTHLEQPQIRFKTKWKIWMLFYPQLTKFKCLLKIKERF